MDVKRRETLKLFAELTSRVRESRRSDDPWFAGVVVRGTQER
jgi:hypothetical protein